MVKDLIKRAIGLHQAGKQADAEALYQTILSVEPNSFDTLHLCGICCAQQGRYAEAVDLLERALVCKSGMPSAYSNLGMAYRKMGRLDKALDSLNAAIECGPKYALGYYNRGLVQFELGQNIEAIANYDSAITLNPNFADAYINKGVAQAELRQYEAALVSYDHAISLVPMHGEAHLNRGLALAKLMRYANAMDDYELAIQYEPGLADAYRACAEALKKLKRLDEALVYYDRAIELQPDSPYILGDWLATKLRLCSWDGLYAIADRITKGVEDSAKTSIPFNMLTVPASPEIQKKCAQIFIKDRYPARKPILLGSSEYGHERIRVGYFSSDFRDHPVSHLISQLIEYHDRSKFEIYAFSFGPSSTDRYRQRLESAFDHFYDVKDSSEGEIASLARDMEINIAVDLNGHTQDARTGIFSLRSAPIQVNYLGYPGTMGADYYDYIIADATVIPMDHVEAYTEKVAYLPNSYLVADATRKISSNIYSREYYGLPDDAFVFCCFNNHYKITVDIFDIWMRLLERVEGSVLWLSVGMGNPVAIQNLSRQAELRGVSPDRLVFARRMDDVSDHLARHGLADLFLDTFYYNAHTTASDALWAGLPVLTCQGSTFAGRVAASLLRTLDVPELITNSHSEYEQRALELALNPVLLAAIKYKLAENRMVSPLFDTALFTKHIENAYMQMWARHQAGLGPFQINVIP